ncbi:hypothetical protein [Yoonia litorea]|uniref:Uncharacterized protein n=1 Tax=Yoonia litorea TaxID=1123755 RepID=A0A1I6MVR4_9RHOB|nr:hypothetical protein [Yoonia litorea]SFS19815.1 hypothetical protein SAMN05444714_2362 [Yoonia litorea]
MLRLNRYPVVLVLMIAGLFAIVFAYATVNLFQMSMANTRFLREYGWEAVQEGAILQLLQIIASGTVAMVSYIGFKICESELVRRYNNWQAR